MGIFAKRPEGTYTPAPEGLHHSVCVDVVDLGVLQTNWGDKHKIRIIWQIEDMDTERQKRFEVRKQYNLSLHEKSTLRKDLEGWRGRKFTDEELNGNGQGFDIEKLIGANCQVQVVQDISDEGRIYANVQAVVPPPKNVPKLQPLDYVRMKDRPKTQGNGSGTTKPEYEDSVPF